MGMFNGLTHAVVFFNTIKGAQESGINAMMKLCFGSDDSAIGQILYRTTPKSKTPIWVLPVRTSGSSELPVFSGNMGEEILGAVGRAADRFKKANITDKAGRTFRVTKVGVEEVKAPVITTTADKP